MLPLLSRAYYSSLAQKISDLSFYSSLYSQFLDSHRVFKECCCTVSQEENIREKKEEEMSRTNIVI